MRALRLFLIYVGFVVVLSQSFPLTAYHLVLPDDMFMYPRKTTSGATHFALSVLFGWLIPATVAGLFMWLHRRLNWEAANAKTLIWASSIYLGIWAIRLAAATVPGGGGLYTVKSLFVYAELPLKVGFFAGALLLLFDLGRKGVRVADA